MKALRITVSLLLPVVLFWSGAPGGTPVYAQYTSSAHGDSANGVNRSAMTGYARGNCAHCHEQHASVDGLEPDPVADANPSPYELFTLNFDSAVTTNTYQVQDDICFRCHDGSNTVQDPAFQNKDYSETFGCGTPAATPVVDILGAVNQLSYHNLYDIWTFVDGDDTTYPWFNSSTNPCSGCHNPHLARRNNANPRDVTFSAISLPTDHTNLFTASMNDTFGANYEPPYCTNTTDREPASSADAATGRSSTVDYVTFCTDCHTSTNTINSTPLGRNLLTIDWSAGGDKHGLRVTEGTNNARLGPYSTATPPTQGVLSCLDCHEPHGSPNITLLRRRVNGGDLTGSIATALPASFPPVTGDTNTQNKELGYLCMRCHQEDATTVNGPAPSWRDVHHNNTGRPYAASGPCSQCHPNNSPTPLPIGCDMCHFHGATDAWLGGNALNIPTF